MNFEFKDVKDKDLKLPTFKASPNMQKYKL